MAYYTVVFPQPWPEGVAKARVKVQELPGLTYGYEVFNFPPDQQRVLYVNYGTTYRISVSYITTTGVEGEPYAQDVTPQDVTPPLEPGDMTFSHIGMTEDDTKVIVVVGLPQIVQPAPDEYVLQRRLMIQPSSGWNWILPWDTAAHTVELELGTWTFMLQDRDSDGPWNEGAGNWSPIHTQEHTVTRPYPPKPLEVNPVQLSQNGTSFNYMLNLPSTPENLGIVSQKMHLWHYEETGYVQDSTETFSPNHPGVQVVWELGSSHLIQLVYVDSAGNEGPMSEVILTVADQTGPAVPGPVSCKVTGYAGTTQAKCLLEWAAPQTTDVAVQELTVYNSDSSVLLYSGSFGNTTKSVEVVFPCGAPLTMTLIWKDAANNATQNTSTAPFINCLLIPPKPQPVQIVPGELNPTPLPPP